MLVLKDVEAKGSGAVFDVGGDVEVEDAFGEHHHPGIVDVFEIGLDSDFGFVGSGVA